MIPDVMVSRTRDRPPAGLADGSAAAGYRPVDVGPLLGVWFNYDDTSPGIARIAIGDWEGVPTVRVTGAGPSAPAGRSAPVDWGEVAGAAFADGVATVAAVGFTATYHLDFVTVLLAGYLNKRLLVVDAYSTFTDGSGRANTFKRDHFYLP